MNALPHPSWFGRLGWGGLLLAGLVASLASAGEPRPYDRPGWRGWGRPDPDRGPEPAFRPGYVVRALPPGYRRVDIGGTAYFEHGGVFFRTAPGGYIVVDRPAPEVIVAAPPVGSFAVTLPLGTVSVSIGGGLYYRHGDVFYRPGPGGYVVVAPPPGVVVVQPPPEPPPPVVVPPPPAPSETYIEVAVGPDTYYYREGLFYRRALGGFRLVDAPVGAFLGTLPAGAVTLWVGPDELFYAHAAFFRKTPTGYIVVEPPRNAYVRSLPRGAREVWCGGHPYHYFGGAFYEARDEGLLITTPPIPMAPPTAAIGVTLAAPPDGSLEVWVSGTEYLYFSGNFYRRTPTGCVVVTSPL